jgi:hypothetical protein
MKYIIILSFFTSMLVAACQKKDHVEGLYIRGRLFYSDTVTQFKLNEPVPGKTVILAENPSDSLNFAYTTVTDSVFDLLNNQPDDHEYEVRFDDKINAPRYNGSVKIKKSDDNDNVRLVATLKTTGQNGFHTYVCDSLGGFIPNVWVRIYNSELLANINSPASVFDSVKSGADGRIHKLNLPTGRYYLNTRFAIDTFVFRRVKKIIDVPVQGFAYADSLQVLRR